LSFTPSTPPRALSSPQFRHPVALSPNKNNKTNRFISQAPGREKKEEMDERLAALEASSRRLASVDFSAPRLYSSLLLENQAVPVRNAKPFEQSLFSSNRIETLRK